MLIIIHELGIPMNQPVQWDGIGVFFMTHLFEVKQPTTTVSAIFWVTGIPDDSTKCEQWMPVGR